MEDFVRQICLDSITPPLDPVIERLTLLSTTGEQLPVLRVEVNGSLFVHRSPGDYLHRVGSAKREMAPDYLAHLFQQRNQARIIRFDEQPEPRDGVQNSKIKLHETRKLRACWQSVQFLL